MINENPEGSKAKRVELRDRFAIAALPAVIAEYGDVKHYAWEAAALSYVIADHMLKARGRDVFERLGLSKP